MRDKGKLSGSPACSSGRERMPASCLLLIPSSASASLLWLCIEINSILFVVLGKRVAL